MIDPTDTLVPFSTVVSLGSKCHSNVETDFDILFGDTFLTRQYNSEVIIQHK